MSTAVITGAGSGVGRAVAIALAAKGFPLALLGRMEDSLKQTAALCRGPGRFVPIACDIANNSSVIAAADRINKELGAVDVLVNCAGTNIPRRSFADLSADDFKSVIDTNLIGAYHCIAAFLPGMRSRNRGTIVNIVSDAGLIANAKAGPAYVASKFGLTGLTQSLLAEERDNGIRACAIFPGDIDTPLLKKRPTVPTPEARAKMLKPKDIAACVVLAIELPERAVVEQLVVRPR
jgi:NAD(P)-dependent dehydrogenase (short-subunit alcohol dehydrogenase family)